MFLEYVDDIDMSIKYVEIIMFYRLIPRIEPPINQLRHTNLPTRRLILSSNVVHDGMTVRSEVRKDFIRFSNRHQTLKMDGGRPSPWSV